VKTVPQSMTDAWKSPDKTGDRRPVVRATIQIWSLQQFAYDTAAVPGSDGTQAWEQHNNGVFTSAIFGDRSPVAELRGIKSLSWQRSVDQDVATATLVLQNSETAPIGSVVDDTGEVDKVGWFTPGYGSTAEAQSRWGQTQETGWKDWISPDRLVKTYEGYGFNPLVKPAFDENLVQTGVWLIDSVTLTDKGDLSIAMRDLGRLLLDQIVFPPVIPFSEYPLSFEKIHTAQVEARDATGGSWELMQGSASSSNEEYVGKGLTNSPNQYVSNNGGVQGHHASHALTGGDAEYWRSTGQSTTRSKVWWEVDLKSPKAVAGVQVKIAGGPYRVYVSLKTDKGWRGRKKIPYDVTTGGIDIGADKRFVKSMKVDRGGVVDIILPRKYDKVEKVRLTFTHLRDDGVSEYPYYAGLFKAKIYTGAFADLGFGKGEVARQVGNYYDYTDIVKYVCAWGGFYWPDERSDQDFIQFDRAQTNGERYFHFHKNDPALPPNARIWGDLMKAGTAALTPLGVETFDKKPLMDVINYVRDVLGFNFWIDETGGVVWRLPNIYKFGNYLSGTHLESPERKRTGDYVTIDEDETLLDYEVVLDSGNLRERIFVGNTTGKKGAVVRGYTPYHTGLRRMAGWTDQHFATNKETRVMAELIAARQLFSYRSGKVTIPGYPRIQIDDQIKIYERVTAETNFHYVTGVQSDLDMESGEWTYTLSTHWLGPTSMTSGWVVPLDKLDRATQNYLNLVGVGDD
jgi:hypothetical protein